MLCDLEVGGMPQLEVGRRMQSPATAESSTVGSIRDKLALFALALGTFCIGTSEFASMGVIQLFARDFGVSVPRATDAITAYALGVIVGAPLLTLLAARVNRRTLLLLLIGFFIAGNLFSAVAATLTQFSVARFISGLPQGAYFGAGAMVASHILGPGKGGRAFAVVMGGLTVATIFGAPLATYLGQLLGWRGTFAAVAGLTAFALLAIIRWVPISNAFDGTPITQELTALKKPVLWGMMAVTSLGISSIFAIYTFVGPFVTDGVGLGEGAIPIALALFGIGMTVGNSLGGKLADTYPARGIVLGFVVALVILVILAVGGNSAWVLMPALFGVGLTMMMAIPTIQIRLTTAAPEAPTLVGAMVLAACNLSNALGAWSGGRVIDAGFGLLSAAWAGFALTTAGLAIFAIMLLTTKPVKTP